MIRQEAKRDFTSEIWRRFGSKAAWLRDRDGVLDYSLKPATKPGPF